jgi:DNA invertase Pin-like site-specific DNA recombinase
MAKKQKTPRVGIYARVSTLDKGQDPENQLTVLREHAERRGFKVVGEFVDRASGTSEDRAEYRKLLGAARKRQIDAVLVWRYDRFARSLSALVNALAEFNSLGVDFLSYQEQIDTTTPQGKLFFGIVSSMAEFESSLISERVRLGMARARAQGKRISRPPIAGTKRREIVRLHKTGKSLRQIEAEIGVSRATAAKYVNAHKKAVAG